MSPICRISQSRVFPAACLLAAAVALSAPVSADETDWPDPPFEAEVVAEEVELRAGASEDFYAVGTVSEGTRVRVMSMLGDWLRIAPPPGVYSLVEKEYVDPADGDRTGQINQNRVLAYAARADGGTEDLRGQRTLFVGASVSIVGEVNGYYRITAPSDVFVFLPRSSDKVRPTDADTDASAEPDRHVEPDEVDLQSEPMPDLQLPEIDPAEIEAEVTRPTFEARLRADERFEFAGEQFRGEHLEMLFERIAEIDTEWSVRIDSYEDVPSAWRERARELASEKGLEDVTFEVLDESTPDMAERDEDDPDTRIAERPDVDDQVDDARDDQEADREDDDDERYAHIEVEVPLSDPVLAAERRFRAAVDKPLHEQPLDDLIERFEAAAETEDLPDLDRRVAEARLGDLRSRQSALEALQRLDRTGEALAADDEQPRFVRPDRPAHFDFTGTLTTSAVFDGTARPRLLRLVSAEEGHTIAYLRPDAVEDVRDLLGDEVAVVGRAERDAELGVRIIDVQWIGLAPTDDLEVDTDADPDDE